MKKSSKNLKVIKNNVMAEKSHRKNKTLSYHDLKVVKPLTPPQRQMMESYYAGNSILAMGSAGTGKTLIALYLALSDMLDKNQPIDNIKIIRSIVPTREVGHLPGTYEEKIAIYELPYIDLFSWLFGMPTSYEKFKASGKVEFCSTSYLRGCTWDDSVIIVDEIQNLNFYEINTVMTRVGQNSKVILAGDTKQTDLFKSGRDVSCMNKLEKALSNNPYFDIVYFHEQDIVRSDFVKSWIQSIEN